MLILTVNSGSTSVKLAAFRAAARGGTLSAIERRHCTGSPDPLAALRDFLSRIDAPQLAAVGHRVVHGGTRFVEPVRVDAGVEAALRELSELAPLHNPKALEWIDAAREACGARVLQVAAFDTAFFARLPRAAAEYALPPDAGVKLGVRRYGFHGIAHEAMWRRWRESHPRLRDGGRVITLQLGGGCSMTAIDAGRPLDTTMGFSPLEGLVMETRSGDVDPAVVPYLARKLGASADQVIERLNHQSGLLGVSGVSADMRALLADGGEAARFAVELYCYRASKTIGAYLTVLGGCDGILFGGGVGEHLPEVRARILAPLEWARVALDARANEAAQGEEACISAANSAIEVRVIPVDEEHALAEAALKLAAGPHAD